MRRWASRAVRGRRPRRGWGFATRLALTNSLLIVAACTALSWTLARRNLEEIERRLLERGRTVAEFLSREAELSVLSGDVQTLRHYCQVTQAQREVMYCRFFDQGAIELASAGVTPTDSFPRPTASRETMGPIPIGFDVWEFQTPIFTANLRLQREEVGLLPPSSLEASPQRQQHIGTVAIGLTLARLQEHRRSIFVTTTFLAALVTIVAVLTAVLLSNAITRPLKQLAAATDAIAAGALETTVPVQTHDEVGALAASFNAMAQNLSQSHAALEESNRDLEEKVRGRTERLETLNRELEEANRLKSEFLATVSHELRTPLNVIIGYSSMLAEGSAGEVVAEQREMLEAIGRYSKQQLDLVTNVLGFSRLASGRVALHVERFALGPLLEDIRALHAAALAKSPVQLVVEVGRGLKALETDRVKLQEIVHNLVDNAVKFTKAGTIAVRATAAGGGDTVIIEVRDTGPGIAPDELPFLFDEFRQAGESSTRSTGGVGLGLSIVKRLVEILGGSVSVSSQLGQGSIFRVEIPRRAPGDPLTTGHAGP